MTPQMAAAQTLYDPVLRSAGNYPAAIPSTCNGFADIES